MSKKHLLQIAVSVFTIILMGFSAWAVPGTINYQGKLTDPNGDSIDGYYIMEFYLYNAESGGSHLWVEQQNIDITNGVYNVELGKTNAFPSGLFDHENLYLEVKIFSTTTGWETLSPRQHLTSTPFAMKSGSASTAGDADTLDGLHASDLIKPGDDYGRSGVAADLYEGTTQLTDKYVNEAQADAITNNMILNDAVTTNKIADGAVGTSDLSENAVTSAKIQDGTIQQSDLSFSFPDGYSLDASDGAPVDAVYVNESGNVGIGTTSPKAKLEVSGGKTILEQEAWQTLTLLNSWVNYGSGYNPAGYFKDSMGIVHLRGLVRNGTDNLIFTLPIGYRPAYIELQATIAYGNIIGRCDIFANGDVIMESGNTLWFSLDGITFRASGS